MIVQFTFSHIDRITATGFEIDNLTNGPQPVAPVKKSIADMPALQAELAIFAAICEASGHCGQVHMFDRSPRGVRAINGFRKLAAETVWINREVGIAAGRAVR